MRVLVCGGRDFTDEAWLRRVLSELKITEIITGEARGADSLARTYASDNAIPYRGFPAEWSKFGAGAGPIRNRRMLVEGKPDMVVAFPGGKGTANLVRQAGMMGVDVLELASEAAS